MMDKKIEEAQLLKLLSRRVERLIEEYSINAPAIIKATELNLIIEVSKELLAL